MKKYYLLLLMLGAFIKAEAQPCLPNTSALDFNGVSSAVRISPGANLEITDQITIEAWVYANSFPASPTAGSIFCKHSWNPSMYGYVLRAGGNGVLSFNIGGSIGSSSAGWKEVMSNDNALTLNTWYHVAGTFDGSSMNLYVNGVPSGSFSFSGGIYPNVGLPARIGALADTMWGMSRYWDGYIDEVRVWNRALSASELVAGMNDHLDPSTAVQLAGYWRFNDMPNAVIQDYSLNNNPGQVLGTTWTTQVPFNNAIPPTPTITYSAGLLHASAATSYQWYFGSSLINGATQQSYQPTQIGNYSVEVGALAGCSSMSAPFAYNNTGIETTDKAVFSISPNPAQQQVRLTIPAQYANAEVQIFSLDGQLLQTVKLGNTTDQELNISLLPAGMYFLKLGQGNDSQLRKLMIW